MEDIEDLLVGSGGVAPPGFRLPITAVGLNPKKKKNKNKPNPNGNSNKLSQIQDPLAPLSPKIPGTQTIYIKTFGCSHNQQGSRAVDDENRVESSSGTANTMANTMMQKFWDSALALEPPDDCDTQSELSALTASDGTDGKFPYPSLGLGNSFALKFEDLRGRMHRINCGMENLDELLSAVMQRIGANDHDRPHILFEDDEGDRVLLATDDDLVSAVSHARGVGLKVLRLHLDFSDSGHRTISQSGTTMAQTTGWTSLQHRGFGLLKAH
ncbi:hypothetical protein CerSpe_059380 [Prunus speciosa]